jgi:hypothetical protein
MACKSRDPDNDLSFLRFHRLKGAPLTFPIPEYPDFCPQVINLVSLLTVSTQGGVSYSMSVSGGNFFNEFNELLGSSFTQSNSDEIKLQTTNATLIQQNSCTIDEFIELKILNVLPNFQWQIKDNPIHNTEQKLVNMVNLLEGFHTGSATGQTLVTDRYILDDANITAINNLDAKIDSDIIQPKVTIN